LPLARKPRAQAGSFPACAGFLSILRNPGLIPENDWPIFQMHFASRFDLLANSFRETADRILFAPGRRRRSGVGTHLASYDNATLGNVMISWFLMLLIIAIPAVLIWYSGPSDRPPWLFRGFFFLIFLIFVLTALLS
jgi:hypothetical protein